MRYAIVTASHNEAILNRHLLSSVIAKTQNIIVMRNYSNVAPAYNDAIHLHRLRNLDFVVFVHHDIFIPSSFEHTIVPALEKLPETWAIAGLAGAYTKASGERAFKGHILDRGSVWGAPMQAAAKVETLDELMIIVRMNTMLSFDEWNFPQDFYGADICMQATDMKRTVWVLPLYVEHHSGRAIGGRTPEFFKARDAFRSKWQKKYGTISTTCIQI